MAAPVQAPVFAEGSGGDFSIPLGAAPANGSRIVVIATRQQNTTAFANPSGWGVTTWVTDADNPNGSRVTVWSGLSNGSSATGTVNAGYTSCSATVAEIASGMTVDGTSINNTTSANSSTGNITPTAAADVFIIGASVQSEVTTTGPTNSWTAIQGTGLNHASYYLNVASASGSYSSGMGTGNNYAHWGSAGAAYKTGAAPPPQTPRIARGVGSG